MPELNSDSELTRRLLRRDPAACTEFVNIFGPRLLHAARRLRLSRADAEELAADAISEAVLSLKKYKARSSLFTWVYGIFLNLHRSRRRRRRREILVENTPERSSITREEIEDDSSAHLVRALPEAIATLPQTCRETILLKYVERLPVAEIASRLGCPEGTVKSRLHNGRLKLRKILKKMNLRQETDTYQ